MTPVATGQGENAASHSTLRDFLKDDLARFFASKQDVELFLQAATEDGLAAWIHL